MRRKRLAACGVVLAGVMALPGVASAKGCQELSDIVGYERCHRFGDGWSSERRLPVVLALELPYMTFDSATDFTATRGKYDKSPHTFPGRALGVNTLDTFGFGLKLTGYFVGPLYTGVTFGFGFGRNDYSPVTVDHITLSRSDSAVNTTAFYGGALLGVRVPLGRVSIRLEGLFGGSALSIDQHSSAGDYSANATRWMIEPRATLDFWLKPNVSVGAYGAVNVLDTNDRMLGLSLEYHVRSFDGAFAFW